MRYLLMPVSGFLTSAGAFLVGTGWSDGSLKTVAYGGVALLVSVIILCTEGRTK